jgi:hypothetical protein
VRDKPDARQQHLTADMGESRQDTLADRAEPSSRQPDGGGQDGETHHGAGQAEEEARCQELADQQAAGKNAQQRHPYRGTPAVTSEHHQHDDVGESRFDARQRRRYRRLGHGQGNGCRRVARDAAIVVIDLKFYRRRRQVK